MSAFYKSLTTLTKPRKRDREETYNSAEKMQDPTVHASEMVHHHRNPPSPDVELHYCVLESEKMISSLYFCAAIKSLDLGIPSTIDIVSHSVKWKDETRSFDLIRFA